MAKDIEREAFKLEMIDDYNMREVDTPFGKDFAFGSTKQAFKVWQAAKAHEAEKMKGYVLVPVQCPDPDFADSLFDELSKKAIGEFGDDLLIHFSDIDAKNTAI